MKQLAEMSLTLMLKLYCFKFTKTLITKNYFSPKNPNIFIRTALAYISTSSLPHWQ